MNPEEIDLYSILFNPMTKYLPFKFNSKVLIKILTWMDFRCYNIKISVKKIVFLDNDKNEKTPNVVSLTKG